MGYSGITVPVTLELYVVPWPADNSYLVYLLLLLLYFLIV